MFHVWPLIDMPEARRARDHIVAWLSDVPEPSVPYSAPAGDSRTQNFPVVLKASKAARM